MSKSDTTDYLYPAAQEQWNNTPDLWQAAELLAREHRIAFVLLNHEETLREVGRQFPRAFACRQVSGRVAVLNLPGAPFDPVTHRDNRDFANEEAAKCWRYIFIPQERPDCWRSWLTTQLQDWLYCPDSDEQNIQLCGSRIRVTDPGDITTTLFLTRNTQLLRTLDAIDVVKRNFRLHIGSKVGIRRKHVHQALQPLLTSETPSDPEWQGIIDSMNYLPDAATIKRSFKDTAVHEIPRVLILGESGSGKTQIARYLARRTSAGSDAQKERPVRRLSMPEFHGDEQRFEFELFGYLKGAFTGARSEGSMGILLKYIGGVLFLDEIGDASASIQAKLLAFMDDYRVTPRGWYGDGIPCPILLIAATKNPIDQWAREDEQGQQRTDRYFRHDLYNRFTHIIRIPSLNDRKEDIPELVDCLLQSSGVNPERLVRGISERALNALAEIDYSNKNLRFLTQLLTYACTIAASSKDPIITSEHVASGLRTLVP